MTLVDIHFIEGHKTTRKPTKIVVFKLILDPINSGPAFRLESLGNFSFPLHAAAARPKRRECMLPPPGPQHRCHCHRVGPPSPPLPLPCQDPFVIAAVPMQGPLWHNLYSPFIVAAVKASPRRKEHQQGGTPTSPRHGAWPPPRGPCILRSRPWRPSPQASIGDHRTGDPPGRCWIPLCILIP
jgi:hypothetical protein